MSDSDVVKLVETAALVSLLPRILGMALWGSSCLLFGSDAYFRRQSTEVVALNGSLEDYWAQNVSRTVSVAVEYAA